MDEQKFCKQCSQLMDCQKVYQQLGSTKGPSVAVKVIVAFLLPLLVFIGCLAVFERIFSKAIHTKELQTLLGFLLALSVTFGVMLTMKMINRLLGRN